MKQTIKDYFNFTRKERIGVLVIIVILAIVFFLPTIVAIRKSSPTINNDTAWAKNIQQILRPNVDSNISEEENTSFVTAERLRENESEHSANQSVELFYFDPNTLSIDGWKKLGVREKTIHTIQNYLAKGGKFKTAEDLRKIYGLSENEYQRINPFIKIENAKKEITDAVATKSEETPNPVKKSFTPAIIELNATDTTALIALPGIGSKLASRIINFRDKLGGFYSVNQVKETYGIADSVFQEIMPYLKVNDKTIKKININSATIDELKAHPYLKYNIAKTIILYRNEHGQFTKLEDLKKVMAVTDEVYNKISPYLTLQ